MDVPLSDQEEQAGFFARAGALGVDCGFLFLALRSFDPSWKTSVAVFAFYMALSMSLTGRTLGKWAAGIRVVKNDGSDMGSIRAIVRVLALLLFLGAGCLPAFSDHGKALHDDIARTKVVQPIGTVLPWLRKLAVFPFGVGLIIWILGTISVMVSGGMR